MQVRIEKLVYGGAGLARTEAGVLFIDRVLPGEEAEVTIFEQKKDFARARSTSILTPSPFRRAPACPNFETVGCCDWSYIDPAEQTRIKETILRESLTRLGGVTWHGPIETIGGPEGGYRLRAVFHAAGGPPGFLREGTHDVVPISACHALMPELNLFLGHATAALEAGSFPGTDTIRAIASPTTGEVAAVFMRGRERANWKVSHVTTEVGRFRYRLRPGGFFQPNRYLLGALQDRVVALVDPGAFVLDLFSGDGFFSLPLARTAKRVVGVDRRSPANAKRNAQLNDVGNVAFIRASARGFMMSSDISPGAIVLDPPRSGLGPDLSRRVGELGAARIVYVSCNPTTFAADGRMLRSLGYELTILELLDQFPNTHHIETIGVFER